MLKLIFITQLGILILIGYIRWETTALREMLESNHGVRYTVTTDYVIIGPKETFDVCEK